MAKITKKVKTTFYTKKGAPKHVKISDIQLEEIFHNNRKGDDEFARDYARHEYPQWRDENYDYLSSGEEDTVVDVELDQMDIDLIKALKSCMVYIFANAKIPMGTPYAEAKSVLEKYGL